MNRVNHIHVSRSALNVQSAGSGSQCSSVKCSVICFVCVFRKERPVSLGIFSLPGSDVMSPDLHREAVETPETDTWRYNNLSHPCSNISLKDELSGAGRGESKSSTAMSASVDTPQGLSRNLDSSRAKPDSRKNIAVAAETPATGADQSENAERSEVQAIIESTPELDMDLSGCKGSGTPTKGLENMAFDRNTDSVFEELSSAGTDLIADVDEGADLLGEFSVCFLPQQMNIYSLHPCGFLSEMTFTVLNNNGPCFPQSGVPTAQRKCFTRVEMARVLMERNQYKEKLMELQEAVRWTEMIRSATAISHIFSRLFSSSSSTTAQKPDAAVNMKFNAPSSHIIPSVKKRSSTLAQLPSDKSRAFDFLNEEAEVENVVSRREQKRAQYRQVKAHVQKEDSRMQAYGWSLPPKYKVANGGQADSKIKNLPVPVYLRPLDKKDASMKLWCAAGVDLSSGKTRDGGSIVGASVFYKDVSGGESGLGKKRGSRSSLERLERLEQELKEQQTELQHQDDLSSLVWICTTTHTSSKVIVIDANQPGNILESFFVCSSHVLCIASVPGARETDYPSGEELSADAEAEGASEVSSTGSDGGLDGITVMGCSAEGLVAIPQTVCTNSIESSDTDEVAAAEEALEAPESHSNTPADESRPGIYTEHVFIDTPSSYTQRCVPLRVAEGWNISGNFPKIPGIFPKIRESFQNIWNVSEIFGKMFHLFATLVPLKSS
uniref:RH2 domain-containing protein n=1 Tax=Sinocyclocheilus grahami TaxID=75366 RepID=A0A672Q2X3_SINGR